MRALTRFPRQWLSTPGLSHTRWARHSSTVLEGLQSSIHEQLTTRPPTVIYDYLSPTPSHLLNVSLEDFLPPSCQPESYKNGAFEKGSVSPLPQGHHLVYFSPQVPSSGLLPDGTDHLQSPDSPFDNRRWAGGSVHFNTDTGVSLHAQGQRACCTETMTDVVVKGTEKDEKVFVTIQRQIGFAAPENEKITVQEAQSKVAYPVTIVEERNLVYFRKKSVMGTKKDLTKPTKILRPTLKPDYSFTMVPTPTLLFRFSALTFNAHAIHLDPQYCREVEGFRNLLVHGPLTLVLMLSTLTSQLKLAGREGRPELIKSFEYRNLAPLYVDEEMRICVKKDLVREGKYDVWIEGSRGGYAVKGTALVV